MVKTRKLTTSIRDRFLGSYTDYINNPQMTNATTDSDLSEEDVWSIVNDPVDRRNDWAPRPATATATDHLRRRHVGGLSLAFEAKTASSRVVHQLQDRERESIGSGQIRRGGLFMAKSAPVNVPDWSKLYRVDSVERMHDSGESDSEMLPPHEYLARSRNKAATSVFEGVGRTRKGRDLNRVRDAVWSQTGFYG